MRTSPPNRGAKTRLRGIVKARRRPGLVAAPARAAAQLAGIAQPSATGQRTDRATVRRRETDGIEAGSASRRGDGKHHAAPWLASHLDRPLQPAHARFDGSQADAAPEVRVTSGAGGDPRAMGQFVELRGRHGRNLRWPAQSSAHGRFGEAGCAQV